MAATGKRSLDKEWLKKRLWGTYEQQGLLPKAFLYILLSSLCFVFIYPFLSMLITSLESLEDLLDSSVKWIPHSVNLDNYKKAISTLEFGPRLLDTLQMTVLPSLAQVFSCSLAGYGLARFRFKGKGIMMAIILLSFILPFHTLMVPTYIQFSKLGILGTNWALVLPALGGQGIRSAIFILICMTFYQQTPQSLDEAARVDGAGEMRSFLTIGLPLGLPAMLTTFLFSFVWYWNETYITNLLIATAANQGEKTFKSLTMVLSGFENMYAKYASDTYGVASAKTGNASNEAIVMAGIILVLIIPMFVYFCLQRYFVESIDNTGITGE